MKIVFISDTHGLHNRLDMPEADVLVHSGDFCNHGHEGDVKEFNRWLAKQDYKHKIVIAGNHDRFLENNRFPWHESITYLCDTSITIDGIKFYGSPWQPEFFNWAFNVPRGKALAKKWAKIPSDTDVLVTHGPPCNVLDFVPGDRNVGCEDLLDRVLIVKPKIHAFGHIHYSYGETKVLDTEFVNASICTEAYLPDNQPIVKEVSCED